ncbi:hypothetical protein CK203_014219 [Vitis vinifera]|uniref:Uncharacterized protein n=1 Tax=Vitis vinifera TaxID=29760 RepID=A0A438JHK8_VITVI|nr:hypothetical protein CK203_014219 [Vitis vinifera]
MEHSTVAVVAGRTRSLVERFERREKFNSNEDQTTNVSSDMMPERQERFNSNEDQTTKVSSEMMPETARTSPMLVGLLHR